MLCGIGSGQMEEEPGSATRGRRRRKALTKGSHRSVSKGRGPGCQSEREGERGAARPRFGPR